MNLVHWSSMAGLLHLVQQGWNWVGSQPAQAPLHCTKCNSPPIDDQCNNHRIVVQWSVTLQFSCTHKRLIRVAQYNKMNDKKITYRLSRWQRVQAQNDYDLLPVQQRNWRRHSNLVQLNFWQTSVRKNAVELVSAVQGSDREWRLRVVATTDSHWSRCQWWLPVMNNVKWTSIQLAETNTAQNLLHHSQWYK